MTREELNALEKEALIDIILSLTAKTAELSVKIAELEARLHQNSANSSKPPSSEPWAKPKSLRKPSGKKPGGQPGHKGHGLKLARPPDEVVELRPAACGSCGAPLPAHGGKPVDTRYRIDVVVKTVITAYRLYAVECPRCGAVTSGAYPSGITSTMQYGPGVRGLAVLLTHYAMVGYDKTRRLFASVFGVPLSAGTLVTMTRGLAARSAGLLAEVAEHLKAAAVIHCDETGQRVNGRNYWMHTSANAEATYNTVHPKRGVAGIDENGVLAEFTGTAVHDCFKPYFGYDQCAHALCNAHLLRELTAAVENERQQWAGLMIEFLLELKAAVERHKAAGRSAMPTEERAEYWAAYAGILKLGECEAPRVTEQRKQTKAHCLLKRFDNYQKEINRFADDFRVPFDNNAAERAIRNVKVKQKVSGGFRSEGGAVDFAQASSVIGTAVKQGLNVFQVLSGIFNGSVTSLFSRDMATE